MKHFFSFSLLLLSVITFTQAQTCCNGFEANFTYGASATTNGIEFENLSSGTWDFIVWNFGDGNSSNADEPDHVYSQPGIYQVCVVIESNDDCRSELCFEVAVETTPDPCNDFLADYTWHLNSSNTLGVQFENISPLASDFYVWSFGDGSTSNDVEPYHEYDHAGMYQVCLVLENNAGCRSEYCREVCLVDPEPDNHLNCCEGFEAWFNYYPTLTENRIEFENQSAGDWNFILWSFGDGETSDQEHPDHIYSSAGIYQVCLVIESEDGCRSELCYEVAVETTPDPCNDFLADFSWDENIDSLGIQFVDISPIAADHYIWHFGDGSTSDNANPYHEYDHPGVYQVCLVIENNDDCRSEYCRDVCVEDFNPCGEFEVEFSWSPSSNPHVIEFDGVYSGQIDAIHWTFGDGGTSDDEHPNHEYAQSGTYEVCLVVENNEGCHAQYCISIVVDHPTDPCEDLEADFFYVVDFENGGVHFEDLSSGNPVSYEWHFGDGAVSYDAEPTHHYTETGLFEACLRIENAEGCVAEICLPVHIPVYYFYLAPPLGIEEEATLENTIVYPNPFTDNINFTEPIKGTIELFDIQGRSVFVKNANALKTIDLSGLNAGLYILRVSDGTFVNSLRLIKE